MRVTCGRVLLACSCALQWAAGVATPSTDDLDLEQCTPLGLEQPSTCAEHWPRHEEPRVVLAGLIKDTIPADLVRQIEYHLLLGVDVAIIFDNSCPDEKAAQELEDALVPYAKAGLVVLRTEYRCVEPTEIVPEKYPIGGSGIAIQLLSKTPELHPKNGTLVLALDDDEYVTMADPQQNLLDMRHELIHAADPSIALKWRMFGSAGHECQPSGSVVRNFNYRSHTEEEMSEDEQNEALQEATDFHLNPPFGKHSQKFAVVWHSPEQMALCDTHNCGRGPPTDKGSNNTAGPSPESEIAWIAHFAYQSEQHWAAKKSRGRTTQGTRGLMREGPVPTRYSKVKDDHVRHALDERIDNVTLPNLRSCLKTLFGPTPAPYILAAKRSGCARTTEEAPRCGVKSKDQPVRIAAAFYGAQRSTPLTLASIEKNLFGPLEDASDGALDVFVHAMVVRKLDSVSRVASQENVELCTEDFKLLRPCASDTDDQDKADYENRLVEIAETALYSNGTQELLPRIGAPAISHAEVRLNIVRSRFSMSRVARLIVQREQDTSLQYTHVVMARADTGFATPLIWRPPNGGFWLKVPNFQHWKGVNDRFAYGTRDAVVNVLLNEFDVMNKPGEYFGTGSEGKMCDYLREHSDLRVGVTPLCLVRVRATGAVSGSDFHIQGNPRPAECAALGLKVIEDELDDEEPCRKVDGEELARWGWQMPPLHDVLQFIHIPKTGGTTVEKIGARYGARWSKEKTEWSPETHPDCPMGCEGSWHPCSPWHLPLSVFRTRGESGGVNSLQQTFCVVRDPVQRAISQYSFQMQAEATAASFIVGGKPGECTAEGLNAHIHAVLGQANMSLAAVERSFPLMAAEDLGQARTCTSCAAVADCHWLPQWLYVRDTCDHVLRFENLQRDFGKLMKRFAGTVSTNTTVPSYAFLRTDPKQVSECKLTKEDLDFESRALLGRVFAEDFRQFGYEIPDAATVSPLATMLHGMPLEAFKREAKLQGKRRVSRLVSQQRQSALKP